MIADEFDSRVLAFMPEPKEANDASMWLTRFTEGVEEDDEWRKYILEIRNILAGADWSRCEWPAVFVVVFQDGSVLEAHDEWGGGPEQICGVARYSDLAEMREAYKEAGLDCLFDD